MAISLAQIKALQSYHPSTLPLTNPCAAVMIIVLVDHDEHMEIVLTKRAQHLPTYAGHFSFPGGIKDDTDQDLYQTAVREVFEELQLQAKDYHYIAQLDDIPDRFGNVVRPFLSVMSKKDFLKTNQISADEIEALFFFPVEKLTMIVDEPALHEITKRRPSYAYKEENVFVWGLTAAILMHLYALLRD